MVFRSRAVAILWLAALLPAQQQAWQVPPEPIASLVLAPPAPDVSLSPDRRWLLLVQRDALPDLADLARPHLKLAGLRVDPRTRGPQLAGRALGFTLQSVADGSQRVLPVPEGRLGTPVWAADGSAFAFTRTTDDAIELWLADVTTGAVRQLPGLVLNAVLGAPCRWLPDQRTLLCRLAVAGAPPAEPAAPGGPSVQETAGKQAPVRTWQDLLQDEHAAALFEHFGRSQLAVVDAATGPVRKVGEPDLWTEAEPSPDGRFLLTTRIRRPFSYTVPYRSFPEEVAVRDLAGRVLRVVVERGLQDTVPIGGVVTGPRGIEWIGVRPHALLWTEALDGGDPRARVSHRDVVRVLAGPEAEPQDWFRTEHRFRGVSFGEDGVLGLAAEFDRDQRRERLWRVRADDLAAAPVLLHERSTQDAYGDPGNPVRRLQPDGRSLVRMHGSTVFLSGRGSGPEGDRPFLDAWDLDSGDKRRLFRCAEGCYESFAGFLDDAGTRLLLFRETRTEPANAFAVDLAAGERRQLTAFTDPAQEFLRTTTRELLHYQRKDGVPLSGTLWLPPGAAAGTPLPALVWAYPQEFTQATDAGQVRGSPHRYERLAGTSHLFLLCLGYAVLDDAAMPIVGPVRTANDSFVEQLVANCEAAVASLVQRGVDPRRIAIAGHSYGAFMTAHALAHSDLFAAGIARSGAYNRTLTPFGFQNEERTFWEAPELYLRLSPFTHAPRIDEPLLLIHGADDNNPGTFPIQSPRLFAGIQGHGGTARLVMLPHESHGYRGRQSVLHCLWETCAWMDRHVKQRQPAPDAARDGGGGR